MSNETQMELVLTIENEIDTIEFIQHKDLHYWVYFNGSKTDSMYPRHLHFDKNMKMYEIFRDLWYGASKYNKKRITNFFKELIPEEFL